MAICSALANIKINDLGTKDNIEKATLYLAPMCLVMKKQAGKKNVSFDVSIATASGTKPGMGSTGVELCYYKPHMFKKLLLHQKKEVVEYNATKDGGKWKGHASSKNGFRGKRKAGDSMIFSVVADEIK